MRAGEIKGTVQHCRNIAALGILGRYPAARVWRNSFESSSVAPQSSHAKPPFPYIA